MSFKVFDKEGEVQLCDDFQVAVRACIENGQSQIVDFNTGSVLKIYEFHYQRYFTPDEIELLGGDGWRVTIAEAIENIIINQNRDNASNRILDIMTPGTAVTTAELFVIYSMMYGQDSIKLSYLRLCIAKLKSTGKITNAQYGKYLKS